MCSVSQTLGTFLNWTELRGLSSTKGLLHIKTMFMICSSIINLVINLWTPTENNIPQLLQWHTTQIHYFTSDWHERWRSFKGRRIIVNHYSVWFVCDLSVLVLRSKSILARPSSKPKYFRLYKTISTCVRNNLIPLYVNEWIYHARLTRSASKRRTVAMLHI